MSDIGDEYDKPSAFTETDQPESHPVWIGEYTILVAAERGGASDIYQADYSAAATEYKQLTSSPAFDGHPATEPACWAPTAAASLEWLQAPMPK